jgi:hypothetical protein
VERYVVSSAQPGRGKMSYLSTCHASTLYSTMASMSTRLAWKCVSTKIEINELVYELIILQCHLVSELSTNFVVLILGDTLNISYLHKCLQQVVQF